ncbi:DUF1120 domain-containing protein [Pseudomonas sp. SBT1-2]|uniref:DUF1120 domain-containing protein n=1 Tax=Pseudomonas sp. SBT1-2 TaxID=3027852 RepID=UPI0023610C9E|nr:DUF1120 domain-containing protein [Pseudomonas sp. SBT1-2]
MNFPKKMMLGSVLLLGASSVFANTADLRVIGSIAPSACTPVFAGGAVVDYGVIPNTSLNPTASTTLAPRTINYSITCNGPLPISTSWSDTRSGTAIPGALAAINYFGLGTHSGDNIGNYMIENIVAGTTADGNPVTVVQRNSNTETWFLATTATVANNGIRQYSYAPVGTLVPGAFSTYAGALRVTATIAPTQSLDMSTEVTLDGLSTMTVHYL